MDSFDNPFDWANNAYMILGGSTEHKHLVGNTYSSAPPSAFTVPAALASDNSLERHGQLTPPDDFSPIEDSQDNSVSLQQPSNDGLWTVSQLSSLNGNVDEPVSPEQQPASGHALKRRRTSKQSKQDRTATCATSERATADSPPPKRRRGRPKNPPQPIQTQLADDNLIPVEITSTRQSHLEKNRLAAHKCRQRKKEYVNGLETRARELSAKNKALREQMTMLRDEVLSLKNEVLRHAGCGFWGVDEYLKRCAGDLLGRADDGAYVSVFNRSQSKTQSPSMSAATSASRSQESGLSPQSQVSTLNDELTGEDDYSVLELLKMDDEP